MSSRQCVIAALGIVLAFSASVTSGWSASKYESAPIGYEITLDGDDSDWQDVELLYREDGVRLLGVAHDADNLYLMWRFGDERLARRVLARGVMVWVNGNAKKKETFGLRYGGSAAVSKALPPPEEKAFQEGPDPSQLRAMYRDFTLCEPGFITLFDPDLELDVPEDYPDGPQAASTYEDGLFVYEVKIPMTSIGGKIVKADTAAQRKLVVGIQVGGLSPAEMNETRERMSERSGAGMGPAGMGPGGGMGGGMRGGMDGGMPGGMGGGMPGEYGGGGQGRMGPQDVDWMKVELAPVPEAPTSEN